MWAPPIRSPGRTACMNGMAVFGPSESIRTATPGAIDSFGNRLNCIIPAVSRTKKSYPAEWKGAKRGTLTPTGLQTKECHALPILRMRRIQGRRLASIG